MQEEDNEYGHSDDDDYDGEDEDERSDDKRASFPFFTPVTPYLKTIVEADPMLRETDTEWDCLADRAAALDEQKVVWCHNDKQTKKVEYTFYSAVCVCSFQSSKMEQFTCPNARRTAATSGPNAIDRLGIVGAWTRIQAKIYPAHRLKMADRIVRRTQHARWKDALSQGNWNFSKSWKNSYVLESWSTLVYLGL